MNGPRLRLAPLCPILSPRQVDALLLRLRQALAGAGLEQAAGRANAKDAGSVIATCLGTLAELLQVVTLEKRAKIEFLIRRYAGQAPTRSNT